MRCVKMAMVCDGDMVPGVGGRKQRAGSQRQLYDICAQPGSAASSRHVDACRTWKRRGASRSRRASVRRTTRSGRRSSPSAPRPPSAGECESESQTLGVAESAEPPRSTAEHANCTVVAIPLSKWLSAAALGQKW